MVLNDISVTETRAPFKSSGVYTLRHFRFNKYIPSKLEQYSRRTVVIVLIDEETQGLPGCAMMIRLNRVGASSRSHLDVSGVQVSSAISSVRLFWCRFALMTQNASSLRARFS